MPGTLVDATLRSWDPLAAPASPRGSSLALGIIERQEMRSAPARLRRTLSSKATLFGYDACWSRVRTELFLTQSSVLASATHCTLCIVTEVLGPLDGRIGLSQCPDLPTTNLQLPIKPLHIHTRLQIRTTDHFLVLSPPELMLPCTAFHSGLCFTPEAARGIPWFDITLLT